MAVDNTLIYGLGTLFVGVLGVLIRYSFKSKCSDVSLCFGLLKIKRDTEAEVQAERNELELRGQNGTPVERQTSNQI
jgi:hypothetical protein